MTPLEEYNSIIHYRQQNPLPESEYGEVHHIIPKSCGGVNQKWNLVRLSLEEHIRCHKLLCQIYPTGKQHKSMTFAYARTLSAKGHKITEKEAEERRAILQLNLKGVPLSEEHRKKLSEAKRRFYEMGGHNPQYGKSLPPETREKISKSMRGKKHKKYVHTQAFYEKQKLKKGA